MCRLVIFLLLVFVTSVLSGCDFDSDESNARVLTATVKEVRVLTQGEIPSAGHSAAGKAAIGAVIGHVLFHAPATGAVIGATDGLANNQSGTNLSPEVKACRLTVEMGKANLIFTYTGKDNSYKCALLKPGDPIHVEQTTWTHTSGSNKTIHVEYSALDSYAEVF